MDPEYTTQKISSAEYVRRNYPRVDGDKPELLTQPLFRKFNADGVNDYRQIIIDTDFVRQQEVVQVTVTIGNFQLVFPVIDVPEGLLHEFHAAIGQFIFAAYSLYTSTS